MKAAAQGASNSSKGVGWEKGRSDPALNGLRKGAMARTGATNAILAFLEEDEVDDEVFGTLVRTIEDDLLPSTLLLLLARGGAAAVARERHSDIAMLFGKLAQLFLCALACRARAVRVVAVTKIRARRSERESRVIFFVASFSPSLARDSPEKIRFSAVFFSRSSFFFSSANTRCPPRLNVTSQ